MGAVVGGVGCGDDDQLSVSGMMMRLIMRHTMTILVVIALVLVPSHGCRSQNDLENIG